MSDRFVDLLRHGEVEGGPCFRGRRDDPLSTRGLEQLREATALDPGWTALISSPARRCVDFARVLASRLGIEPQILPELAERDFGDWEGLIAAQIPAPSLSRFWDDPTGFTPPGGEPHAAFRERVLGGWRRIDAQSTPHALVLTHGGVVRLLLAELLGLPARALLQIEVAPASLSRLRLPAPPGRPSLMRHGCA